MQAFAAWKGTHLTLQHRRKMGSRNRLQTFNAKVPCRPYQLGATQPLNTHHQAWLANDCAASAASSTLTPWMIGFVGRMIPVSHESYSANYLRMVEAGNISEPRGAGFRFRVRPSRSESSERVLAGLEHYGCYYGEICMDVELCSNAARMFHDQGGPPLLTRKIKILKFRF
jgi:hypothetical protein